MRISDWSSDVCSSDLRPRAPQLVERHAAVEDVAADQPETGFEIIGRQREMADHRLPEAGCCRFDGIENRRDGGVAMRLPAARNGGIEMLAEQACDMLAGRCEAVVDEARDQRSEEHTSELQSLMRSSYAVFCLKTKKHTTLQDRK